MKEKAFSFADDFTIKTASGVELFKCKGKILSISDKKSKAPHNAKTAIDLPSLHRPARKRDLPPQEQTLHNPPEFRCRKAGRDRPLPDQGTILS